jgi:hypothetical protein
MHEIVYACDLEGAAPPYEATRMARFCRSTRVSLKSAGTSQA